MNYFILYPASFFLNFSSFTIIMVCLNFLEYPLFSVYIAVIHSIGLFVIKSFSGEARTLANHKNLKISSDTFFKLRFLLTIPCVLLFFFFAIYISNLNFTIVIPFLIRLILEWFEEIFLIEIEKDKNLSKLKFIFLFQLLSVLFCLIIILTFKDLFLPLLIWSFSSLFFFKNFYINFLKRIIINFRNQNLKNFFKVENFNLISTNILSTFLLGFLIFIFRETIINFTGINNSSNFFTAFAIGGVLASYFINSLGHKSTIFFNKKITTFDVILIFILLTKLFSGILLVYLTFFHPNIFKFSDDPLFFRCLGFSLVGSTIMIIAQIKRFKILKNKKSDFLGINLIVNMILVISIPLFYYLFDTSSISIIYLISGVLHLIFVFSFENNLPKNFKNFVAKLTVFLLIIPIFFQLTGQVFINSWGFEAGVYNYHLGTVPFIFNHNNELALLPIPFSLATCIIFVLIIGDYKNAKLAFILISSTLLVCTTIIIASNLKVELMNLKFINLCQIIIPYSGMIVGLIIFKKNILEKLIFEKLLFYILILFLPLQIGFTYLQNIPILTPFMYFFSIYQHLQYVPTVFLVSFIIVFFQLWDVKNYRYFLIPLTFIMLIYCYMSNSSLVIYLFYSFLIIFLIFKIRIKFNIKPKILILAFALIITALFTKVFNIDSNLNNINYFSGKAEVSKVNEDTFEKILKNKFPAILLKLEERINKWTYYYRLINENNFILYGENEPRKIDFRPHNFYIDMIYNFGILSLIPFIILSAYTFSQMLNFYKIRRIVSSKELVTVFTLFFIICFFIFVDNNLKVSLKQPYSGIFIFFIWGKLLSNLNIILGKNQCARSSAE